MAKKQSSNKSTPNTQENRSLTGFFKKKETHITSGVLLLVLVTYLCIVLVSFLFSGDTDQSKVNLLAFSDLSKIAGKTENIGGAFGAWVSNLSLIHI
jgi:S-DNA-T family DNA segregation ATPase FtsK/SpoIIIE